MLEFLEKLFGGKPDLEPVGRPSSDYAVLSDRPQPQVGGIDTLVKDPVKEATQSGMSREGIGTLLAMLQGGQQQAPASAGVIPAQAGIGDAGSSFGPKRAASMPMPGGYADGGAPRENPALAVLRSLRGGAGIGFVQGPGDGRSDDIPAPHLADGEYVIPADVVAGIGNGSSNAGARALHEMVGQTRADFRNHLASLPGPRR